MYLLWQKSLSAVHLLLPMSEIRVRHNSSVSESAAPGFSSEELHVSGARITPVTSHKATDYHHNPPKVSFNHSIAAEDFHQQRTSGYREKLSVSAGPGCWSWQVPSLSSQMLIP